MAKKKETKKVELKEVSRVEINGNIIITYEDGSVKIIPAPIMLTADQASEIFGSEDEEEEESDDDEDEEESEDDEDEDDSDDDEDEEESEDDEDGAGRLPFRQYLTGQPYAVGSGIKAGSHLPVYGQR